MNAKLAQTHAQTLDQVLTPEPWCVDQIGYDGNVIEISGWALAPEGRHDLITFTVNGLEFTEIEFPGRGFLVQARWWKLRVSVSSLDTFGKTGHAILRYSISYQLTSPIFRIW